MCTRPKTAWLPLIPDSQNKTPLLYKRPRNDKVGQYEEIATPCNHCPACLKSRALDRAMRLVCEMQTTTKSAYFITYTYDEINIPKYNSLQPKDITNCIKKMRRDIGTLKYLQVGEYGGQTERPHHHMAYFGEELTDLKLYQGTIGQPDALYTSLALDKCWKKGSVKIALLTMQNAIYISQYIDKKVLRTGKKLIHLKRVAHCMYYDKQTNKYETIREPEYVTSSQKPAIGKEWFNKYSNQIHLDADYMVSPDGRKIPIPKYFYKILKENAPELHELLKRQRVEKFEPKTKEQNVYQEKFDTVMLKVKNKRDKI